MSAENIDEKIVLTDVGTSGKDELSELKERQYEAEKALQFGVLEYDIASGLIVWSKGVYDILCHKAEEAPLNYNAFISLMIRENYDELDESIKVELLSKNNYQEEYEVVVGDNITKIVKLIGRRIHDANGVVLRDVGIIKDISAEKEKELDANKAINELLRSNKELESFAYIASHDLQEPVRKIGTFGSRLMLLLENKTEDEVMYLKRIMSATESMKLLIDNLLEYSRISKNTEPFVDANLNFILQQVITDLELVIEESGAVVTSGGLPNIEASATRMKQLFNNIIGNSIKFTTHGVSPNITITSVELTLNEKIAHRLPEDKVYHKIEIKDNGIGFEEEYAKLIFQVFQRLNGKSEYPGSGIGLAICKKIVEQHNGLIYASGVLGEGAIVSVILPEKQ